MNVQENNCYFLLSNIFHFEGDALEGFIVCHQVDAQIILHNGFSCMES